MVLLPLAVRGFLARLLLRLPGWLQRRIAGEPVCIDGLRLETEAQLLLKFVTDDLRTPIEQGRREMRRMTALVTGRAPGPLRTRELTIDTPAGEVAARLYRPDRWRAPGPLLVYYHGGGWVNGDLDTHDGVCRFLAVHAGVSVLAVDYRRAPEHPFPAGLNDALAAYRYAASHAEDLGADPSALAVGGDSAGGNLALVVARLAAADEHPPAFQLLIYPATDARADTESKRLFAKGFLLTTERMDWYLDHYLPDLDDRSDPRASPLHEPAPHLLPPTYLVTAGFDPLRDEGERLAARLAEAGVPVALRRFDGLYHGFTHAIGVGRCSTEAMLEIASALRVGLALRPRRQRESQAVTSAAVDEASAAAEQPGTLADDAGPASRARAAGVAPEALARWLSGRAGRRR